MSTVNSIVNNANLASTVRFRDLIPILKNIAECASEKEEIFDNISMSGDSSPSTNTYMNYGYNIITTASESNCAARLPLPIEGRSLVVINTSSQDVTIFPSQSGGYVNGLQYEGIIIPPNSLPYLFACYSSESNGEWACALQVSENFMQIDSPLNSSLQKIKDRNGNSTLISVSNNSTEIESFIENPFTIKAGADSGAQFDLKYKNNDSSAEYAGLRVRGTDGSFIAQFYHFKALGSGQGYSAIWENGSDVMQIVKEGTVNEVVFPTCNIGIGLAKTGTTDTSNIHPSAKFQINSTSKGSLMPRMTNAQMNAISSPAAGLEVYNTDWNGKFVFNGTSWQNASVVVVTTLQMTSLLTPIAGREVWNTDLKTKCFFDGVQWVKATVSAV